MYFYILDGTHSPTLRLADRLKRELSGYGIAGEITKTDPIHTPKLLSDGGRLKGYSTIVAVGTDEHINLVAHSLIGTDVAFGFIPIGEGSLYQSLIGVKHWNEIVPMLRNRHTRSVAVGETDLGSIFLDRVTITNPTQATIRLAFPAYSLELNNQRLTVKNGGLHGPGLAALLIETEDPQGGLAISFERLFRRDPRAAFRKSALKATSLALLGDPDLEVRLDGTTKITLPVALRIRPRALRAIIGRVPVRPIDPSTPLRVSPESARGGSKD